MIMCDSLHGYEYYRMTIDTVVMEIVSMEALKVAISMETVAIDTVFVDRF